MTTRTNHRHGDNLDQQFKTRSVEHLSLLKSVKKFRPMIYLATIERFIAQKLLKVIFWRHLPIPNPLKSHAPKKVISPLVQHPYRNAQVVVPFEPNTREKSSSRQV